MRQRDWEMCSDMTAERGAECNTDHNFICMELQLKRFKRTDLEGMI